VDLDEAEEGRASPNSERDGKTGGALKEEGVDLDPVPPLKGEF